MRTSESDLASVFHPIGNIVGWCLFFTVTTLPLSGLALGLYANSRWTANGLTNAWIISFVAVSLAIYALVEAKRRTPLRALALRGVLLTFLLTLVGSIPPSFLFGALDRGKQKRAIADLSDIAAAIDRYVASHHTLADVDDVAELSSLANLQLPTLDPWGCAYRIHSQDDDWFLISTGSDCVADVQDLGEYIAGPEHRFEADMVVKNGEFLKWPEGMRHRSARPRQAR